MIDEARRQQLLFDANAAAGDDLTSWAAIAALALDEMGKLRQEIEQLRGLLGYVSAGESAGLYLERGLGWYACLYCESIQTPDENGEWGEFPHRPDCPIVRARAMLGDT